MKHGKMRSLLAGITTLVLLISCTVSGLVLPVAAADASATKLSLTYDTLWLMTGRTRSMGTSTVTYSDGTTSTVAASGLTWSIADTSVATIDASGLVTPLKVGETTITGTLTSASLTATCALHVVDGSQYVYADVPHTLGDELLANGDFEQGTTNWTGAPVVSGVGKGGGYGLQLTTQDSSYYYKNAIALQPDTTYVFSYDYLPGKNSSFYVEGSRFQTGRETHTYKDSADRTWQTYSTVFTTSKTMSLSTGWDLVIHATKVDASEPVVIDNLSVREYVSDLSVETLHLSYDKMTMYPSQTWSLIAYSDPYGGNLNGMTWSSNNDNVVTVKNGVVKAQGAGTATVTATAINGKTATCVITVTGEALFLKNGSFEEADTSMWKTADGALVKFANGNVGNDAAGTVMKVEYYHPVMQTISGIQPNTTYTIKGSAKLSAAGKSLGISVVCGDTVLFSQTSEQYTVNWDKTLDESEKTVAAPFATGYSFTTPATLPSDQATVIFSVLKEGESPATATAASKASGNRISQGEGEVVDDEDDLTLNLFAYLNDLWMGETTGSDVDLTVSELFWSGDDNGQVDPDQPITFSVKVKNLGTDAIPAGKAFTVDFSVDTEVVRTVTYTGGVAAGAEVVITAEPWVAVSGDHMIAARVNAAWDVMETDMKTNNTYQLNLRVATDRLSPTYTTVQNAVQQAGMDRLTMSDDFNSLDTVDIYASGAEGYKWYVTRPWGATTLTVNDYMVNNGVLTLMAEEAGYNIALNSVDVNTLNGFRYKQGYLEVRLRVVRPSANGDGEDGIPAVWSFTQDKALEQNDAIAENDTDWVELDWLEYWGISKQRPNGYYTITLHDSTTKANEPAYSNSNAHQEGLGDAEWHVMGWLWEKNSIRCFLDGVEVMNQFYDPEAAAVPNASPKTFTIENEDGTTTSTKYGGSATDAGVFSWANDEAAVLYLGGSKDNPLELDYVRIWQTSEPDTVSDNMTMSQTSLTVEEKSRTRLSVTVPTGEDIGTLTWNSSNPAVATVHGNGEVYARSAGNTVVTATNANGVSVWCTVTVTHNLIAGGDFEWDNDLLYSHWTYDILSDESMSIAADPSDASNHCLKIEENATTQYYFKLPVKPNTSYRLTGRVKSDYKYINKYLKDNVTVYFSYASSGGGSQTIDITSTSWANFSLDFTTSDSISNNNYVLGIRRDVGENRGNVYMDDLLLVETDYVTQSSYTVTTNTMTNGSVSLSVDGSAISSGASVAPGSYVDVTVNPASGYQLRLGSLEYSYAVATQDGTYSVNREVLNKKETSFGSGNGYSFRMVMPAGNVSLSAAFEKTADCSLPVATLGTSVFMNEQSEVSGVRFLNRMYVTDWQADGDAVYITYNGQKVKVAQFGTLLKRSSNTEIDLTLENYEAHKSDNSETRIWRSVGCVGSEVHLVDYTSAYIDFTIVMTSSVANRYGFLDREYTTCAYVVLEDGTTLYTDAFTDSVLGALERSF